MIRILFRDPHTRTKNDKGGLRNRLEMASRSTSITMSRACRSPYAVRGTHVLPRQPGPLRVADAVIVTFRLFSFEAPTGFIVFLVAGETFGSILA